MKKLLALLLICATAGYAESPLAMRQAQRALEEGIPQAAVAKLRTALADAAFAKAHGAKAKRLLAEALLAARQPQEALEALQDVPETNDLPTLLLRANIEASTGQWDSAFRRYQELSERPDAPLATTLGEAECLQALGRTEEAVKTLRRLIAKGDAPVAAHLRLASLYVELARANDARKALAAAQPTTTTDRKWRQYLEARILLLENQAQEALSLLEEVLQDKVGLSPNLFATATLAAAEARLVLGGTDLAGKVLEGFIRQYPDSPQLELIFRRLDQIYAADTNPAEGPLHAFFLELPPRASALAQFYVARLQFREKRYDRAVQSIATFLKKFPTHDLVPYAHRMRGDIALKAEKPTAEDLAAAEQAYDAAAESAKDDELRAELTLRAALVNLYQKKFEQAANRLTGAKAFPRLKKTAAYNAALGWLMHQNYEHFREEAAAFAAEFPQQALVGQLRLEEGLLQARTGNAAATTTLRTFLREFPDHPRAPEAKLGLAELAFHQEQIGEAAVLLVAAKDSATASPQTAEHADYLAVFIEDKKSVRKASEVIARAKEFIARHPQSARLSEVRMKLGQIYFAEEDYLKAQEQFETLASADPTGPYAEMALFLAGQCGMKLINTDALNHAVELFDKVAERKGALEMRARLQQAIIKNKLGAEDDAVKIYDSIISAPALADAEVRYAALIGKGDNLVAIAQKRTEPDPAQVALRERALKDAIQTYHALVTHPDASATWKNQAAYKKGKAFQQLGRLDEALAVFYDVMDQNTAASRETFWFAKAGFDAAGLLEGRQQWKNAVAVYEKMARVAGPHVAQAQQRIKTLRLEHFLWD